MAIFTLNGRRVEADGDDAQPLLWFLRDRVGLTGTKFGCGAGLCGACTVHVDGRAQRACITTLGSLDGKAVVTIEGLADSVAGKQVDGLHPVQKAWIDEDVAQCGYCQAGQIMATADLLQRIPNPTDDDIEREHSNLCRCGTYTRIRRGIHRAAALLSENSAAVQLHDPTEYST